MRLIPASPPIMPSFPEALRIRHTNEATRRCEACGEPGAKFTDKEYVFDAAGRRPRILCTDFKACVARVHDYHASLAVMVRNGEGKSEWRLTRLGRKLLVIWGLRCYHGPPPTREDLHA